MTNSSLSIASLRRALAQGWRVTRATRGVGTAYALVFTLGGLAIIGGLLAQGWAPFVIAAAGAFMLVGPAMLAGFFGIADAFEAGEAVSLGCVGRGFARASRALVGAGAGLRAAVHDLRHRRGDSLCLHGRRHAGLARQAAAGQRQCAGLCAVVGGIGIGRRVSALLRRGVFGAAFVRTPGRAGRGGGEAACGSSSAILPWPFCGPFCWPPS
jgi:hypothetical protein